MASVCKLCLRYIPTPALWRRVMTSSSHQGSNLERGHNFYRPPSPRRLTPHRQYHRTCVFMNRKQLATLEGAHEFISSLSPTQQTNLNTALMKISSEKDEAEIELPSWKQLRLLCYQNMLPFIGFGFLDNFIMITVADRIEETIGVMFCLSTMAAAGIGNMVSDLSGLGLADRVDALCRRFGIPDPKLTSGQLILTSSRWMSLLGRCVGIIIGCVIGMCPLLWIHTHTRDHTHQSDQPDQN